MNKKDLAEIRRKFKKESATFSRLRGCYVDGNKNKILTFSKNFLNLPDEEFYKYLDIAKKNLSGTLGNHLIELNFPLQEEKPDGKQYDLLKLRDSELKDDDVIDSFFNLIINNYECTGNYLILLYHDCYDIPCKTKDSLNLDDSEEVFNYILCTICPVQLSKPALGYNAAIKDIGARDRDWVVCPPESGFLFPCFTERSTDIHSVLTYNKDTKYPHKEVWESILGCDMNVFTADEKQKAFFEILNETIPEDDNDSFVESNVKHSVICQLNSNETNDVDVHRITESETQNLLENAGIDEYDSSQIAKKCVSLFKDQMPQLNELVSKSEIHKIEDVVEKNRLVKENEELKSLLPKDVKSNDKKVVVSISKEKEANVLFSEVNGIQYLMIPVENTDTVLLNGNKKDIV